MENNNKFVKYMRIPHLEEIPRILNNPVEVYEKIDGGNVQVRKINERIFCGSRANFLIREKFFSQKWFKNFQKGALGNKSFYNLPENLVVYGEWTAKHTLDYKPEFTNKFFLIDIFDLDKHKFIPYEESRNKLSELEIKGAVYLKKLLEGYTTIEELEEMISSSDYRDGDKEGLVIKDYDSQTFAKLWTNSVRKKGIITSEDISFILLSLKDNGKVITEQELIREVEREFHRSKRNVPLQKIIDEVETFYSSQDLD